MLHLQNWFLYSKILKYENKLSEALEKVEKCLLLDENKEDSIELKIDILSAQNKYNEAI
jgi:hypothetical protein